MLLSENKMNTEPDDSQLQHIINLYKKNELIKALEYCTNIEKEFPFSIKIKNLLAELFYLIGDYEKSIKGFEDLIVLDESSDANFFKLGLAYEKINNPSKAFYNYEKAFSIAPEKNNYLVTIFNLLTRININNYDPKLEGIYNKLILKPNIFDVEKLIKNISILIKSHPNILEIIQNIKNNNNHTFNLENYHAINNTDLLKNTMRLTPIPDPEIELFLKNLRKNLLINEVYHKQNNDFILEILICLSYQCFINEYIYNEDDTEKKEVDRLKRKIEKSLKEKSKINLNELILLSCYIPLHFLKGIRDYAPIEKLKDLFKLQVNDYYNELLISKEISSIKNIKDPLSKEIEAMYKENPYPRWNEITIIPGQTVKEIIEYLKLRLNPEDFTYLTNPDVLIAGCGTGHQSIQTYNRFKNCKMTAIDLSLASLSYAKRKSIELEYNEIEYLHCDILDLDSLDKKFDIVECCGVLHHMSDPEAGLKKVKNRLKSEGLMKIALYSKFGWQDVVEAGLRISDLNLSKSNEDIKFFRDYVFKNDKNYSHLLSSYDFYSLSNCRDLLFHVKVHLFTLIEIKELLERNNLAFLGFEMNKELMNAFKKSYPNKDDIYSLPYWHDFELKNRNMFSNMYHFWVKKI